MAVVLKKKMQAVLYNVCNPVNCEANGVSIVGKQGQHDVNRLKGKVPPVVVICAGSSAIATLHYSPWCLIAFSA
jgi:hypothetical protein